MVKNLLVPDRWEAFEKLADGGCRCIAHHLSHPGMQNWRVQYSVNKVPVGVWMELKNLCWSLHKLNFISFEVINSIPFMPKFTFRSNPQKIFGLTQSSESENVRRKEEPLNCNCTPVCGIDVDSPWFYGIMLFLTKNKKYLHITSTEYAVCIIFPYPHYKI